MPIITSQRVSASPQIDGRIVVREEHSCDSGELDVREYIAEHEADLDAMLESNGQLFLARLAGV